MSAIIRLTAAQAADGAAFNTLYASANVEAQPEIDFVAPAASMGAHAEMADDIADLETKIRSARDHDTPSVIVIETDPYPGAGVGGHWGDVAVPETSERQDVRDARRVYEKQTARQRAN